MIPEELLAGAGTIIAHEISHAFENGFRTNPHPMDHLRVNVLLAQFPEFQETYDIQPGDGMHVAREDRIGIWGMPDNAGGETSGSAE